MSSVTIFQSDHFVLSTNFLFKFNVSLPLVTGELLQNTVDGNNVTYKLYNIKLQRLPVLLNTKNYLSTGQATRNNKNIVTSQIQEWPSEKCCEKHKTLLIGDEHTINSRKIRTIIAINDIT